MILQRRAPSAVRALPSVARVAWDSNRRLASVACNPDRAFRRGAEHVTKAAESAATRGARIGTRGRASYSSMIETLVMATGESGRSRELRGAPAIWSTTSRPFVTWPKIV